MNLIDNRGCAYGDGFFSTMGVYRGVILWLDYHIQRLIHHANSLYLDIDIEIIINQLHNHAYDIDEGIIKIVITRVNQSPYKIRGYGFANDNKGRQAEVFIKSIAQAMPHYHTISDNNPITFYQNSCQSPHHALCLRSQLAHLPTPLVGLKSLNRLDSVLIAGEFEQAKSTNPYLVEGLVADVTGQWIEGVMSNVFYQLDDNSQWHTPPIIHSGVNGVMRQVIINYYKNNGQTIIERDLTSNDLPFITGLFFTNAVKGVITIDRLWLSGGEFLDFNK